MDFSLLGALPTFAFSGLHVGSRGFTWDYHVICAWIRPSRAGSNKKVSGMMGIFDAIARLTANDSTLTTLE